MEGELYITGIQAEDIDRVWNMVAPMLEKSIEMSNGNHTIESVYGELKNKTQQLWIVAKPGNVMYAGTTKIVVSKEPKRKIGHILFVGGSQKAFLPAYFKFNDVICGWAKENGCDYMLTYTRAGTKRFAKKMGWEKVCKTEYGDLLFKELDEYENKKKADKMAK